MHTQQLICFVCVADRLNFTKAAEELFLSAPTVTHHIKTLENELNTTLFIRNSKMVRLTEAGRAFYEDAKDILAKIELAEKKIQHIAKPETAYLKIGCTSTAEFSLLNNPLKRLHEKYPDVCPNLYVNDYFSLKNLFENEQLDVILSTRNMSRKISKCTFIKLYDVMNYAVFLKDSPLSRKEELTFADMKEQTIITLHPKSIPFEYPDQLREQIMEHNFTHFDIHCENDQAGILLAECGYGVVIFPELCIPDLPDCLEKRPFEKSRFCLDYGLTYRPKTTPAYIHDFIHFFTDEKSGLC